MQVDEIAIYYGLTISDPTNSLDGLPNIQWMVGMVSDDDRKIFFQTIFQTVDLRRCRGSPRSISILVQCLLLMVIHHTHVLSGISN